MEILGFQALSHPWDLPCLGTLAQRIGLIVTMLYTRNGPVVTQKIPPAHLEEICDPYEILAHFRGLIGREMDLQVVDRMPSSTRAWRTTRRWMAASSAAVRDFSRCGIHGFVYLTPDALDGQEEALLARPGDRGSRLPDRQRGGVAVAVRIMEFVALAPGGLGVVGGPDSGVTGQGGLVVGPGLQPADAGLATAVVAGCPAVERAAGSRANRPAGRAPRP